MLIAAAAVLIIGMCVIGWGWSRVARKVGPQRLSWTGIYPPGTGWRLRVILGLGAGMTIWGGMTLAVDSPLSIWLVWIVLPAMLLPWIVVTVRHNRAVSA
ncbi:hypothetical protein [Arenivirga flava]|nr:hypothetical protein [Arenivirga flava]